MTHDSTPDAPSVRRRVQFFGRVQGVGFRATTVDLSRGFSVCGFVANLPDGSVELEAQGPPAAVDAFVAAVRRRFASNIRDAQASEIPPIDGERGLVILY